MSRSPVLSGDYGFLTVMCNPMAVIVDPLNGDNLTSSTSDFVVTNITQAHCEGGTQEFFESVVTSYRLILYNRLSIYYSDFSRTPTLPPSPPLTPVLSVSPTPTPTPTRTPTPTPVSYNITQNSLCFAHLDRVGFLIVCSKEKADDVSFITIANETEGTPSHVGIVILKCVLGIG